MKGITKVEGSTASDGTNVQPSRVTAEPGPTVETIEEAAPPFYTTATTPVTPTSATTTVITTNAIAATTPIPGDANLGSTRSRGHRRSTGTGTSTNNTQHGTDDGRLGRWCRGAFSFPQVSRQEWIVTFTTGLVALVLCDAATDVCGFLEASVYFGTGTPHNGTTGGSGRDDGIPRMERRGIGINVYEDADGECVSWRKGTDRDDVYCTGQDEISLWKVVRWMVGIASVSSLLWVITVGLSACCSYHPRVWTVMTVSVHVIWVLYILSFTLFGSHVCRADDCTVGTGAALMLVGVLVWILASWMVWRLSACVIFQRTTADSVDNNTNDDGNNTTNRDVHRGKS